MALWGHLQSTNVDSGTGSGTTTLAYTSNVTIGNILVAGVRLGGSSQNPIITDSQGNTWTRLLLNINSSGDTTSVHWLIATSTGALTVTLTNSVSGSRRWIIAEYDAAGTTVSVDQSTITSAQGTAVSSGTVTTTTASELLVGVIEGDGFAGDTFTPGAGYTVRQSIIPLSQFKLALEDIVVSSTGSYVADGTLNNTMDWAAGIVAFKSTGSPAAGPVGFLLNINQAVRRASYY